MPNRRPLPTTRREAVEACLDIAAAHPENVNPWSDFHQACMYTALDAQPGVSEPSHCIVGQLAAECGLSVPDPDFVGAASAAADRYEWDLDDDVIDALTRVQLIFDGFGSSPRLWRIAADSVREEFHALLISTEEV